MMMRTSTMLLRNENYFKTNCEQNQLKNKKNTTTTGEKKAKQKINNTEE